MSELLSCLEVFKCDAFVHLVEESDLVEGLLEVPTEQLVVDECLLGQQVQVLLERFTDEMVAKATEDRKLGGLTAEK